MAREKIKRYLSIAQKRLHSRMKGESLSVTQSAALDILAFAEREAKRLGVSLPPDFHSFRENLQDLGKVQALIKKGREGK